MSLVKLSNPVAVPVLIFPVVKFGSDFSHDLVVTTNLVATVGTSQNREPVINPLIFEILRNSVPPAIGASLGRSAFWAGASQAYMRP